MSNIILKHPRVTRLGQSGMASILITMITMIIVSLVVLGFAAISRREQGDTLDQQLSTQAFYAAEAGVNDARNIILNDIKTNQPILPKTNCTTNTGGSNYPTGAETVLDSAHDVSYTCLLVTPVSTAEYDGIGDNSRVIPITSTSPITSLNLSWVPTNNTNPTTANCPSSTTHTFSSAPSWNCDFGLLRMDLVPTQGTLTRAGLESSDLTAFFEPYSKAASGTLTYSAGTTGKANVVAADCNTTCSVTINGLPSSTSFGLRINSLYQSSDLTVKAYSGATLVQITGQVSVDVTGNAGGVLRRIQVRIPTTYTSNLIPDAAVETNGSLCKRFEVTPTYFSIPGDIATQDPSNAMCQPVTNGTP